MKLAIIGNGRMGVVCFGDAFISHLVILLGIFLQTFPLLVHLFLQHSVLFFQMVDDTQFLADEPFDDRAFNVVSRMNGFEELVKESFKITFIKVLDCFFILNVGLCLFQSLVNCLPVVEAL